MGTGSEHSPNTPPNASADGLTESGEQVELALPSHISDLELTSDPPGPQADHWTLVELLEETWS
jgi:hypothetical protein